MTPGQIALRSLARCTESGFQEIDFLRFLSFFSLRHPAHWHGSVCSSEAEKDYRYLLYAIPVVGIAGELLLRKGPIVRKAGEEAARQVRVKAGRTTRGSKVIGASAPSGKDLPGEHRGSRETH